MIRQVYKDAKTFFHIALWLVILLIVVMSSKSVLGLSAELAADNNVISGETAIILFGSDDYTASHELKIDGTPVATSSPYNWLTTDGDIGLHSLLVTATAQNGLTSTAQQTITVESANAALSIEEPSKTEYTNTPIPVLLLVNDAVTVCDASLGDENVALTKNGNFFSGEMNPVDGIYTLSVLCMAGATQIEDSHTLLLDTQAPETLSSNVHNGNSIVIETSEVATCRAWRESNSESTAQEMTSVDR
ncbi:hypothetical protein GOV10_06810, partial [Candidatus Woesearchaeota archaeon]|nr:hypothetical protein [Candidatus Woesearchaeota archaeon]